MSVPFAIGYAACPHCGRVYRVLERHTAVGVTYRLRMHWRTPNCYQQTAIEKAAIYPTESAACAAEAKHRFADALGVTTKVDEW